jgi:phosphatidylglycerol---prolipoprotein diacylglyceryl transferase
VQPTIHVAGVSIKTFGIAFALGFLAAGLVVARRFRELGKPVDWAYEIVFASLVGGVVGAKLYYVIQHGDAGSVFTGTGLVWYGGVIGGAIGVLAWGRWRGVLNLQLLDISCIPLALGYVIGRIGCQVSGDGDYGIAWDGPWAMAYPHGTVPTTQTVHPTPIYETITMGLVTWWLWRNRDAFLPGVLFAWYMLLSGLERFLVEFIRRNDEVLAGLTAPQLESLGLVVAGIVWLVGVRRRRGRLRRAEAPDREKTRTVGDVAPLSGS